MKVQRRSSQVSSDARSKDSSDATAAESVTLKIPRMHLPLNLRALSSSLSWIRIIISCSANSLHDFLSITPVSHVSYKWHRLLMVFHLYPSSELEAFWCVPGRPPSAATLILLLSIIGVVFLKVVGTISWIPSQMGKKKGSPLGANSTILCATTKKRKE